MKHSVEELTAIAYQYFPRGMSSSEPLCTETVEYRRRISARARASAEYDVWREMLRRIQARFPQELHPGVMVENRSIFLQSPTAGPSDLCFSGALWLPVSGLEEKQHQLAFLISFVAPYYVVYGSTLVEHPSAPEEEGREVFYEIIGDTFYAHGEQSPERPNAKKYEAPKVTTKQEISFRLSEEEALFARGLVEEIEAAFPDHLPMPPEVGQMILPDVSDRHELGETTLFDCLFTGQR